MAKLPNKYRRRLYTVVMAVALMPVLISAPAIADSLPKALPSSQGWFWDRPPPPDFPGGVDDPGLGDPVGQHIATQFSGDHLYVGWDPADAEDEREMFAGVVFDFFALDIPVGATITQFRVTALENRDANGASNETAGESQGIVACPWPEFFAGSPGTARSEAPEGGGDCASTAVPGIRSAEPVQDGLHSWTFDITTFMGALWANDENPAFSIEPNADNGSDQPWITAFRASTYSEPKEETDPFGEQVNKPGVFAAISWTPPATQIGTGGGDFEEFEEFTTGNGGGFTSGPSDFDTTIPETTDSAPQPLSDATSVPVAGAFHGPSADFWDIPIAAWLAALVGVLVLSAAGIALQAPAVETVRPAGAVQALMRGDGKEMEPE